MLRCVASAVAVAIAPHALAAQLFLGFGGLEARAGVADPKNGGSSAAVEIDLGYIGLPALRTTVGFDAFNSTLDRMIDGERVGGQLSGAGAAGSLRYDFFPQRTFTLHLLAGTTIHSIRATPDDPSVKDSLGGGHVGLQFGTGVSWRIGSGHFWSATADVRRVAERDVQRTLIAVGLRFSNRGRLMYDREDIPVVTPKPSPSTP